ncbi:MAG: S8 family serine peptidase, partial [Candidatus Korobacteraceae bacterium]
RTEFNLNNPNGGYAQEHPGPGCLNPGINGADGEATLDVEWAGAAAPGAHVVAASCQDVLIFGGFLALQNILQGAGGRPPDVVSISYGEAEVFMGASYNQYVDDLYAAAGAQGISVYVSAGDHGPDVQEYQYGINVSGFASTPDNVAVGGTDFEDSYLNSNGIPYSTYWNTSPTTGPPWGSALRYIPEIPWNSSCASELLNSYLNTDEPALCNLPNYPVLGTLWAGSGGPSECSMGTPQVPGVGSSPGCIGWAQPNFQNNFPGITNNVRDLPDVSLFAAGGPPGGVWGHSYVFCFSDPNNGGSPCTAGAPTGWAYSGGTSFAAPIWAGIQALLNQKINSKSGLPNNILYSLASTPGGLYVTGQCNSNTLAPGGPNPGCIFYDVTSSNPVGGGRLYTDNDVPCQGDPNDNNTLFNCYLPSGFGYTYGVLSNSNSTYMPDYQTTAGWDFATGIGTVNVQNLVNNWPIPPVPINCWPYLC